MADYGKPINLDAGQYPEDWVANNNPPQPRRKQKRNYSAKGAELFAREQAKKQQLDVLRQRMLGQGQFAAPGAGTIPGAMLANPSAYGNPAAINIAGLDKDEGAAQALWAQLSPQGRKQLALGAYSRGAVDIDTLETMNVFESGELADMRAREAAAKTGR